MTDLHPDVAHLADLLGTWQGNGRGTYPTIDDFTYEERVEFWHAGKPFLGYQQRTKRTGDHPEAGVPLHAEDGYLRGSSDPSRIELTIAQPSGIVETHTGTWEPGKLHFRSDGVLTTPLAKRVDTVERIIALDGDRLDYEVFMGAVGEPHQLHLTATLHRIG